jgi:hypothetical protein
MLKRRVWRACNLTAGLETADGDDLVPRPDPDGEGAGSTPQNGVGAAVGAVERRDDAAAAQGPHTKIFRYIHTSRYKYRMLTWNC